MVGPKEHGFTEKADGNGHKRERIYRKTVLASKGTFAAGPLFLKGAGFIRILTSRINVHHVSDHYKILQKANKLTN